VGKAEKLFLLLAVAPRKKDDFPPVVPASPASWLTLDAKALREMRGA
jgi:hypothetical protein